MCTFWNQPVNLSSVLDLVNLPKNDPSKCDTHYESKESGRIKCQKIPLNLKWRMEGGYWLVSLWEQYLLSIQNEPEIPMMITTGSLFD